MRVFRKQDAFQEQRAFLDLFGRLGDATDATAQLGLNRNTCYRRSQKTGLARRRADQPSREDFVSYGSPNIPIATRPAL